MPRSSKNTHTAPPGGAAPAGAGRAAASEFVRQVRLDGRARGLVKLLRGFSKSRHSVPDFASPAANSFLAKLCADELAEEAEAFFQKARAAFGYKRKDISLDVASPSAVLTARDFTLEWAYALDESAPAEWTLVRTLHTLQNAGEPAFDDVFAGMFDTIVFSLTKGARVEAVIDAVESLDAPDGGDANANNTRAPAAPITVDYPSDCSRCTLRVEGVSAEVVFDGGELSMVFARAGSPRELVEAFAAVRHAFAFTRLPALEALL